MKITKAQFLTLWDSSRAVVDQECGEQRRLVDRGGLGAYTRPESGAGAWLTLSECTIELNDDGSVTLTDGDGSCETLEFLIKKPQQKGLGGTLTWEQFLKLLRKDGDKIMLQMEGRFDFSRCNPEDGTLIFDWNNEEGETYRAFASRWEGTIAVREGEFDAPETEDEEGEKHNGGYLTFKIFLKAGYYAKDINQLLEIA